jgi:very-short-patch-repair endonuclease
MEGYVFRRQRPVLTYIADFMCIRLKLIIEVDGRSHTFAGARERDAVRQRALESAGFRVIRFSDGEVLNEMGWVKERIVEEIRRIERGNLPLTPSKEGDIQK